MHQEHSREPHEWTVTVPSIVRLDVWHNKDGQITGLTFTVEPIAPKEPDHA